MDVAKFEWLVTNQCLFFAPANGFPDPFEGSTPEGVLKWWKSAEANATNDEQRDIFQHNCKFLSEMAAGFREHYYVSCWHMNRDEDLDMWKCYTTSPEAITLRTTYCVLRECVPNYVRMGMVRYIDYLTERLPMMNMFEYIMHKQLCFSFEREVRAVVWSLEEAVQPEYVYKSQDSPGFHTFLPPVDLSLMVRGIVLHPRATPDFHARMISLCSTNGLPKPETSKFCEPTPSYSNLRKSN